MKLGSTSLPRLLSAEDTAGGALPVRDSLTGDPVPSNHNLSMESTQTFHGEVCTTSALSFWGEKEFWGLWLAILDQQARSCGKAHSW